MVNSVITNATAKTVNGSSSTPFISRGIPVLNSETIAANSATISNVSGATLISNAYKTSLQDALLVSGR